MNINSSYFLIPRKCLSNIYDQENNLLQSIIKNQNSQNNLLSKKATNAENETFDTTTNKNNNEASNDKLISCIQNNKRIIDINETIEKTSKSNSTKISKFWENKNNTFNYEYDNQCLIFTTTVLFKEGNYNNCSFTYRESKLIIKNNKLYVFPNISSISSKDILLCINFDLLTCILLCNKKNNNEFSILVLGTSKQYSFIINNKEIKEKFTFIIGNIIYSSEGYKNNLLGL